jgi:hypothetical protein
MLPKLFIAHLFGKKENLLKSIYKIHLQTYIYSLAIQYTLI